MSALVLPSSVAAVTVFRRGAMVTRTAQLDRGDGGFPPAVRLEGLPLLLDDDSLQVEVQPTGEGSAPLAGDLRVTLAVPKPDPTLRPPTNDELEAADLEVAIARQARADLKAIYERTAAMTPAVRGAPEEGSAPMASPTATRLALLDLRRERLEALRPQQLAAQERVRLAEQRLKTLQERERQASQAKNPRAFEARKAVVVSLLPAAGHPVERLELRLRYFVAGARWAPSYVLRLDPSLTRGTLELRALVGQATGERWSEVALTLSTAHPQQWTELPELHSLRIGRAQPPPPKTGWRPPPSGTALLYADYDQLGPASAPVSTSVASNDGVVARPPPLPAAAPLSNTGRGADFEDDELDGLLPLGEANIDLDAFDGMVGGAAPVAPQSRPPKPYPSAPPPPGGAPMPPPTPMAPPAPMMAAPMMAAAPARARRSSAALDGFGAAVGLGIEAPAHEPEGSPAWTAHRDLLEYGGLFVPAADDPRRGTLARADRAQRYGRWADLPAAQIATALSRAERARKVARVLEDRAPPGGHGWAETSDGFDYAYVAQARASLDSDGRFHGLPLRAPAVQTRPRYIGVPRESTDVFRVLVLRNPIDAPLLPGPVDIYRGGRFVLASTLELTPPGGRVELGLGVELGIKVARNVHFGDEAGGMLKRHRKLEHHVRVEIRNTLGQAARVEIRERLPVTQQGEDDIEVTEHRVEPAWDELTQHEPPLEGGRVWTVEIPAGAQRTLQAQWSIRIPNNHELVGGNRREG
ncbi:MAG: DUF4139 domain-containing protein [Myxococcota bacterium]